MASSKIGIFLFYIISEKGKKVKKFEKPVLVGDPYHLLSRLLRRDATACHDGDLGGVPGVGRLDGDLLGVNSRVL